MAIQYTGSNRNDLYAGIASPAAVMASITTTLTALSWTITDINRFTVLTVDAIPANNETVTLNGKVYTFKTVINNANDGEVLIGLDVSACLVNLKAACNLGTGAGTLYSSATTLNAYLSATLGTSGSLNFEQKTAGVGLGYTVSETLANGSFSTATVNWFGHRAKSQLTAQGLDFTWFYYSTVAGDSRIRNVIANSSELTLSSSFAAGQILFPDASVDIRIIANPYQFFIMQNGVGGNACGSEFYCAGVPWLPNFLEGTAVSGAATSAGLVNVTTATAHGLITGNAVTIRGVLGVPAANVTNNAVTVIDTTHFTLDGSVFAGAYVSGGRATLVGSLVVEAIWNIGSSSGTAQIRAIATTSGTTWTLLNGSPQLNGSGTGALALATVCQVNNQSNTLTWFNGSDLVTEPFLCWGTAQGAVGTINGQLWDVIYARVPQPKDVHNPPGSIDGKLWWNLTDNNTATLGGGSFLHVVP